MQKHLSASECVRQGWETFKKRPWTFIGILLLYVVLTMIASSITGWASEQGGVAAFVFPVLNLFVVQIFLSMGLIAFTLRFYGDPSDANARDLWAPKMFWSFLGMYIVSTLATIAGFIALIIPGIIIAIGFMFAQYLVIDKELGSVESLKESWHITKGHRWDLFVLVIVLSILNIIGTLALLVGLLISIPVTMLATVYAYRTLAHTPTLAS